MPSDLSVDLSAGGERQQRLQCIDGHFKYAFGRNMPKEDLHFYQRLYTVLFGPVDGSVKGPSVDITLAVTSILKYSAGAWFSSI